MGVIVMREIKKTNYFIFFIFLLHPAVNIIIGLLSRQSEDGMSFVTSILVSQILLILVPIILFYLISGKTNPCFHLKFRKLTAAKVGMLIAIPFCSIPITGFIRLITTLFVNTAQVSEEIQNPALDLPYLSMLFLIAVLPAFIEELLVRGILFSNYRTINVRTGILLSSFLFGMLHYNFDQFFYATALGIILALVYEFTENLVAPMIVHFIINGTSVTLTYLIKEFTDFFNRFSEETTKIASEAPAIEAVTASNTQTVLSYLTVIGGFAALSVLAVFILIKIFKYFATTSNKLDVYHSLFKKPHINFISIFKHWPISACVILFIAFSLLLEFL